MKINNFHWWFLPKFIFILFFCILALTSCQNMTEKVFDVSLENTEFDIENTENGKIFLRLNPELGDKKNHELHLKIRPNRGIIPLNTELIANLKLSVHAVDDTANTFHLDFQRFQMSTDLMGAKVKYDSQSGENALPQEMTSELEQLLAKKIIMQVDSLGQIIGFSQAEDLTKTESMNMNLNAIFLSYPAHSVGTGEFWTKSQSILGLGDVELKFIVDKITDSEVLIKITTSNSSERIYDINGQYLLDRTSGLAQKGELSIEDKARKIGVEINLNSL